MEPIFFQRGWFHHVNHFESNWIYILYDTIGLNCKKKIDTPWNASHFSWAKRVGCTSNFVRPWVVVGDVYGRHSGNQCAAGAGWLDRYYDYGCFVEIQKKKPPELEDEFPFGIRVMNKRLCVTMSSVAGNFNFLVDCEAPRTVCGWEKCGLSTSQLAAIVCKLLCFCVSFCWVSLEKACGCFIGQLIPFGQVCFLLQITSPSQGCHFQCSLIGQLLKGTLAL